MNVGPHIRDTEQMYNITLDKLSQTEPVDANATSTSETDLVFGSKTPIEPMEAIEPSEPSSKMGLIKSLSKPGLNRKQVSNPGPRFIRSLASSKSKQFQAGLKRRHDRNQAKDSMSLVGQQREYVGSISQPNRDDASSAKESVLYIRNAQQDLWSHAVESSLLSSRAWALQERLLSPRILHYTKTQLFWECKESKACESSPKPLLKVIAEQGNLTRMGRNHKLYGLNVEPLHEHWMEIIEYYTTTSMTRPQDKLAAISGLAKEIQDYSHDTYCAGIWRRDLLRQLLWRPESPQQRMKRPYRAPSWSWASIDGKVVFESSPPLHGSSLLNILSVRTIGVNSQPWSLGQIEYGSLRVRGVLINVQHCEWRGNGYQIVLTEELDEEAGSPYGDYYPDVIPETLSKNLICLPILRYPLTGPNGAENEIGFDVAVGLVLSPTGEFANEYQRQGKFWISDPSGGAWMRKSESSGLQDITII